MGLVRETERVLRAAGLPIINVGRAKKRLFSSLREVWSFHFAVYRTAGANWLVMCGEADAAVREEMAVWEKLFAEREGEDGGEVYLAVYAVARGGAVVFIDGQGERLNLVTGEPLTTAGKAGE
jgi:hypothetical protein